MLDKGKESETLHDTNPPHKIPTNNPNGGPLLNTTTPKTPNPNAKPTTLSVTDADNQVIDLMSVVTEELLG